MSSKKTLSASTTRVFNCGELNFRNFSNLNPQLPIDERLSAWINSLREAGLSTSTIRAYSYGVNNSTDINLQNALQQIKHTYHRQNYTGCYDQISRVLATIPTNTLDGFQDLLLALCHIILPLDSSEIRALAWGDIVSLPDKLKNLFFIYAEHAPNTNLAQSIFTRRTDRWRNLSTCQNAPAKNYITGTEANRRLRRYTRGLGKTITCRTLSAAGRQLRSQFAGNPDAILAFLLPDYKQIFHRRQRRFR